MHIEKVIKDSLVNFDGKVAVYYDDLNRNVLNINGKEKLAYLDKHYVNGSGILRYLSKGIKFPILDVATLMMIISDNVATNMLIYFLGIDKINETIQNVGCSDTKLYSLFKSVENEVFSETTAYDYYLVWKKLNDYELLDKKLHKKL